LINRQYRGHAALYVIGSDISGVKVAATVRHLDEDREMRGLSVLAGVSFMRLQELLETVPPQYRHQFARFIQFGELDAEFERAINDTPALQKAVDRAVDAQAAQLGRAASFRAEDLRAELASDAASPVARTSASLARALESALELPPDERNRVLQQVRDVLGRKVDPARLAALVQQLVA
jgi:hypothetical protein